MSLDWSDIDQWEPVNPDAEKPPPSNNGVKQPVATVPHVFIPDWTNKPPFLPPVVKLAGVSIVTYQNISTFTAAQGSGKTSCIEATGASFLNPECDSLGISVHPSCRGVLIADTERTPTDVWNSFSRMYRRAGMPEGGKYGKVKIIGLRGISDPEARKKEIENQVRDKQYGLLLIDGLGDLVSDTNDMDQVKKAQDWMRFLTVNYDLSIIGTIHPNPGTERLRGHSGSEALRDSETVLIIKDSEDGKIITSDFAFGKNRNTGKVTQGIKWSDEKMMFISTDYQQLIEIKKSAKNDAKRNEAEKLAKQILPPPSAKIHKELYEAIMKAKSLEKRQAKTWVENLAGWGIINKQDDGYYRLTV